MLIFPAALYTVVSRISPLKLWKTDTSCTSLMAVVEICKSNVLFNGDEKMHLPKLESLTYFLQTGNSILKVTPMHSPSQGGKCLLKVEQIMISAYRRAETGRIEVILRWGCERGCQLLGAKRTMEFDLRSNE